MIINGDALSELKKFDSGIVQTCITSPPYWGLRDYGCDGQLGLEPTPEKYTARLVEILAEVKRVLRDDGTLWLVLGDSYTGGKGGGGKGDEYGQQLKGFNAIPPGLKPKDLVGIPWRVAFALQADGWYLRSDIIWSKPNPMPESVTDRPTKAHEYIFLLAKSQRYFYDGDAIREAGSENSHGGGQSHDDRYSFASGRNDGGNENFIIAKPAGENGRNKRTIWTIATQPYPEAHFAVFPPALIEPCVLAGSAEGDTVLDPFCGSGTTGLVALQNRRQFIGVELNPEYVKLAEKRLNEIEVKMF